MKTAIVCLCGLVVGVATAHAETRAQKLKYIHDIVGVSCSADQLTVYAVPHGAVSEVIPASAYVTIVRGTVDAAGVSWVYVSNEKNHKKGWVDLDKLSCI